MDTKFRLVKLMERLPRLHTFGASTPPTASAYDFGRESLAKDWKRVDEIIDWLKEAKIKKISSINRKQSSYKYKHVVEEQIGYITNGQFIAAAILSGFEYEWKGPNAYFNMSQKDWNRITSGTTPSASPTPNPN